MQALIDSLNSQKAQLETDIQQAEQAATTQKTESDAKIAELKAAQEVAL